MAPTFVSKERSSLINTVECFPIRLIQILKLKLGHPSAIDKSVYIAQVEGIDAYPQYLKSVCLNVLRGISHNSEVHALLNKT